MRGPDLVQALKDRGITSFAMELVPRISPRAIHGRAVLAGFRFRLQGGADRRQHAREVSAHADDRRGHHPSGIPCWSSARGVAGLQAIATAKRLGAVVEAYDVRSATKDQVKSLGAKFIETGVSAEEPAATPVSSPPRKRPFSRKFWMRGSRPATR